MGSMVSHVSVIWRRLEWTALLLATVGVLSALAVGVARRHFDVDEIQHTHVMWRISVGDRPFHDFVETHPPFVWYLGAPIVRVLPRPATVVLVLRSVAALAGLGFVFLVMASTWSQSRIADVQWLAAAALLMLSNSRILDYFLEIRPDSITYCLLFLGLFLFLRNKPHHLLLRYTTFAFLASTAVLWTPKLALLVVLFAIVDLVPRVRSATEFRAAVAGHATGISLALAAALFVLRVKGIDPVLAYKLSIGFHYRFLSSTSFSYGLVRSIRAEPVQLTFVCIGVAAWLGLVVTKWKRPTAFELSVLGYLTTALFVVHLPYKQYFAPWFTLAAVFVVYVGVGLQRLSERASRIALMGILVFVSISGWRATSDYTRFNQVKFFQDLWEVMNRAADEDGRVIAVAQWHPITRRDVFYGWFSTFDPGGRDTEFILREWNPAGYGTRFTREGYLREITRHPPALIVTVRDGFNLPPTQEKVVAEYLRERGAEYVRVDLPGQLDLLVHRNWADWRFLRGVGYTPW